MGQDCAAAAAEHSWVLQGTGQGPAPHCKAWTHGERPLSAVSTIMEKTPNQQERNSAWRSSFFDSNPKNPVQIPIVDT